jgi:Ca2+-binding RTX toxin-like protein
VLWSNVFQLNTTDSDAGGDDQRFHSVTHLDNGNILAVWESNSSGAPGQPAGFDIIGQIFDPAGVKVGGEIRLNTVYTGDDEQRPSVIARPGGGFAVVFEDVGAPNDRSIRGEAYNAAGILTAAATIAADTLPNGYANFEGAQIAASTNNPIAGIAWIRNNGVGDEDILFRVWNTDTNSLGAVKPVFVSAPGTGVIDLSIARLNNGYFAIAYSHVDGPQDSDISVTLYTTGAVFVGTFEVAAGTAWNSQVNVAPLATGGGFVVTWGATPDAGGSRDVMARIFDSEGVAQGAAFPVASSTAGYQHHPAVTALTGNEFVAVWADDETDTIRGQRFDGDAKVGTEFVVTSYGRGGSVDNLEVQRLADGRFTVSWTARVLGDHDVRMAIFDPRDAPNVATSAPNIIAGTIAADAIFAGLGNDAVYAGAGDDTVHGGGGADFMDGGAGLDIASYYGNAAAVQINLGTGAASGADAAGDTFRSIEGVIGTAFTDLLIGNSKNNILIGGAGNDTLKGAAGNDTLDGGAGADEMQGGTGDDVYVNPTLVPGASDTIIEAADGGIDTVHSLSAFSLATLAHVENLLITGADAAGGAGNALNNLITGNQAANFLSGDAGNDTLIGGGGADTLYSGAGADLMKGGGGGDVYLNPDFAEGDVIIENPGGAARDAVHSATTVSIQGIANVEDVMLTGFGDGDLTGNELGNVITGTVGKNKLVGREGNDTLIGGSGNDTMNGGAGADVFRFGAFSGKDIVEGFKAVDDRFDLSGGAFTAVSEANGHTTLTHGGGTIVVKAVTGLSLADWNALVVSSEASAAAPEFAAWHDGSVLHAMSSHIAGPGFAAGDYLIP